MYNFIWIFEHFSNFVEAIFLLKNFNSFLNCQLKDARNSIK